MNEAFWKQFPPIPGFDAVAESRRWKSAVAAATAGMSDAELIEYFNEAGRAFRETGKIPANESDALVMREEPPAYGEKKP